MTRSIKLSLAALALAGATGSQAQSIGAACGCPPVGSRTPVSLNTLVDGSDNQISATTTLTCNNLYTLDTRYYVGSGQDLIIEPGTVIKCNDNAGIAFAVIITRGGQIWADGSAGCPIIFTATADALDGNYAVTNRGLWGGLILMGQAYTNKRTADGDVTATATNGVGTIEGLGAGDNRHLYGMPVGTEINNDNSGTLRYVSLRHGGEVIGANNEINGLTMGGVGSGTTIDHVEVIGNKDDAFEFFGGTVNAHHLVYAHCDDDGIDWDQGYSGKLQFVYGLQGPDNSGGANNQGDNGLELDSDDAATNFTNGGQRATAVIYNATIISRTDGTPILPSAGDEAIEAKERTNGTVVNSVFANFRSGLNLAGASVGGGNTSEFWNAGGFNVLNCTFQNCANPLRVNGANVTSGTEFNKFTVTDGNTIVAADALINATLDITQPNNVTTDPVNPVPAAGTASSTLAPPMDGFYVYAKYRGAFEPGATSWTREWTLASRIGSDLGSVAGCAGDLDKDGDIDSFDFGAFSSAFGGVCY